MMTVLVSQPAHQQLPESPQAREVQFRGQNGAAFGSRQVLSSEQAQFDHADTEWSALEICPAGFDFLEFERPNGQRPNSLRPNSPKSESVHLEQYRQGRFDWCDEFLDQFQFDKVLVPAVPSVEQPVISQVGFEHRAFGFGVWSR
jgi:hypothetical protein